MRRSVVHQAWPVLTALPASPVDGQEIYFKFTPNVTPGNTTPILWHLRWDASIPCWLPVGDQRPILSNYYPGVISSVGSGAWGTYDANDPRINAFPLAGTYEVETGVSEAYSGNSAIQFAISMAKNGTPWAEAGASSTPLGWAIGSSQVRDVNTFVTTDIARQYYYLTTTGPLNIVIRGRYLSARPMRIG